MIAMSSHERHERQVALVRASLGLSPREHLGCWKRSARGADVAERPTGIRR
jgi:hypothetical protein